MKDLVGIGIGIFLGGIAFLGSAFERQDFRSLPYSDNWFYEVDPDKVEQFSRDLAAIALGAGFSDAQKASLLAAARRVSPLNKEVFLIEYNLSIGKKTSTLVPIPREKINTTLAPYIKLLSGKPDAKEFFEFISRTIESDPASVKLTRSRVFCVTEDGYSKLTAVFKPVEAPHFEFIPNSIDSPTFLSAYRESLKYLSLQDEAKLSGWRIEFRDESEGYGGKSAALPCAVLTKAFLDNIELDPEVAYVGDVNADGSVQPVGDLLEKLQHQKSGLPGMTVIPKGDVSSLSDILILSGPSFSRPPRW